MSHIIFESFLFWLVVGTCVFIAGYAIAQGTGRRICLISGLGAGVLLVGLGAFLVFCVQTDSKSIRKTIYILQERVESGDVDGTLEYVEKNARDLRALITSSLRQVEFERTKISDFRIDEINKTTSPPRAIVSFRASGAGRTHGTDPYPFNGLMRFHKVELRQEQDGVWRVTDNIDFDQGF